MSRVVDGFGGLLIGVTAVCLFLSPAHAFADSGHVVISHLQPVDSLSASDEIISVYNNAVSDVEVTGWCLYYASAATTGNGTKLLCLTPQDTSDHIFLPSHRAATFVSKQHVTNWPNTLYDGLFSSTLATTGGQVRLLDAFSNEVDKVGWGGAVSPEQQAAAVPSPTTLLSRILVDGTYIDSDNNATDFQLVSNINLQLSQGSLYDKQDLCPNIDDIQLEVPSDLVVDEKGDCVLPVDDACPNMLGVQPIVPAGYALRSDELCWLSAAPLQITELLPNPSGSDTGKEFIELYNPNDEAVDLSDYVLKVGIAAKAIKFTHGEVIPGNGYLAIDSATYSYSLLNSADFVALATIDGQLVDQIIPYSDPNDGAAWALFDGEWRYTTTPTPGAANILSFDSVEPGGLVTGVALASCAANQYRNPATGRCKLLPKQGSTLVPCKTNQVRSTETGRCRIIAAPAKATACPAGQTRNETTHRCRKTVSSAPPKAGYAVVGASTPSAYSYLVWTIVGISLVAAGYAVWEWHDEIAKLWRKTRRFVTVRK